MDLNALLDFDVLPFEQEDQLAILIELTVPAAPAHGERAPAALQVVVDRSGSMDGRPLDAVRQGLARTIRRLHPDDRIGVVSFDHEVELVVPAGPVTDRAAVLAAIDALEARGSTNLSAGYLRGLREARRAARDGRSTVLLLTDGMANDGVTDPDRLGELAAQARQAGVLTTTVGVGEHYDEQLLDALAQGGSGEARFARNVDELAGVLGEELDGLLDRVVQAATLTILPRAPIAQVTLWNDLPTTGGPHGIQVELGDLFADDELRLVLTIDVPQMATLGLAHVADLQLDWVELPDLVAHQVTQHVHVNVVPGDQAAGRIPDATVRSELLIQQAQRSKREAEERLRRGDDQGAAQLLDGARQTLTGACAPQSPQARRRLDEEIAFLASEMHNALDTGESASATAKRMSTHRRMRAKRATRRPPRPQDGGGA